MTSIPWNRINTGLLLVVLLAIIGLFASRAYGGPLDPPSAPSSTDGVREPGTPISAIPLLITQPGRYYLTRNLTGAADASGVTIAASDVTLDLHGFTLKGVPASIDGVLVSGARTNVTIMNGGIRGWYNGIDASTATYVRISGVTVLDGGVSSSDGSYGIISGEDSVIEDCTVSNNMATGARVLGSVMRNCLISHNGNDGVIAAGHSSVLQNNRMYSNGTAPGSWANVRLITNNTLTDNALGFVIVDVSITPNSSAVTRNSLCGKGVTGAQSDASIFVDNIVLC